MATLVFTAIGAVVGGPFGASLGMRIGQAIDAPKAKRREGPRLTELAVQTSSYGTQMPKLFGATRVAGTVIWAADLIETRSTGGGGKGQPKVATYAYAASFAVALSTRPILAVRRIWADGNLLRGAAGDFKVKTGFRLHMGGEEQTPDPLIASAEGGGATPAYRGIAYAVFEALPLAEYGNRIPSLTFEVIADADPVEAGVIARALADEIDAEVPLPLEGFAASGGSVGAVVDLLARAGGGWLAPTGGRMRLTSGIAASAAISDAGVAVRGRGAPATRSIAAVDSVPRTLTLMHYDSGREYQAGIQRARRPGPGRREDDLELPAVMSAGAAKSVADAMLARAEHERVRREVSTGLAGMALQPGTCVSVAGEAGRWRIAEAGLEAMVTRLTLVPVAPAPQPRPATSGRVSPSPDLPIGRTVLEVFETAVLNDEIASAPRLTVAATGTGAGWRRAALLYSMDDGATWQEGGASAASATIGRIAAMTQGGSGSGGGGGGAALRDLRGSFVVELLRDDMTLTDADDAALDRGANLAMIGDELVQFGRAEPVDGRHWRVSRLLRGRRASEASIGSQAVGDRFVLLEPESVRIIELPLSAIGRRVLVMAAGSGDGDAPPVAAQLVTGEAVRPPAPIMAGVTRKADGGALIAWHRRSRGGWRWSDGIDAPLIEERELYRLTVTSAAGRREIEIGEPCIAIAASERAGGAVTIRLRQAGTHAESPAVTIVIPQGDL